MALQNRKRLLNSLQTLPVTGAKPAGAETFVNQLGTELDSATGPLSTQIATLTTNLTALTSRVTALESLFHAGQATLAGGIVTVPATWLTSHSRIVATPILVPSTASSTIFITNITPGTSFAIKSEDATDHRVVNWISIEEP